MGESLVRPGQSAVEVNLDGKRALVTGAAGGIGKACAERLVRAGAAVAVPDLNGEAAHQVADEIRGEPLQTDHLQTPNKGVGLF